MITRRRHPNQLSALQKKFSTIRHMVGNTPIIEILYQYRGLQRTIYAKCEQYNLTGSIKDRMALLILEQAYAHGQLRPGQPVVEATIGNTGISFCALGRTLGHHVTVVMPDTVSRIRIDNMKSLGGEVVLVPAEEGLAGAIRRSVLMTETNTSIFVPRQFENKANLEAHRTTTAPEILRQLASMGLKPDAFVAGVGTGGTIMGIGTALKAGNRQLRVHPLELAESPTLSIGFKIGAHRIHGISDEFIPPLLQLEELDEIIQVNDGDAILMARKMAASLGLGVGLSSGANIIGAMKLQEQLGERAVVVTVLPDSNKLYLGAELARVEPLQPHYLSAGVELLDYTLVRP